MEYEIEEQSALFDPSNNPSLDHSSRRLGRALLIGKVRQDSKGRVRNSAPA